ncbi:hypothetical protein BABINDRAFT_161598 [Babjeviella inositovora NRRL Y-12698]|uniref:Uncharacterized protein n=1 Tax=Babjeviella inositovora NRRL Y-12698 TaxID=984486 RepID=A0A1E3QSD6_9ASCO|nr:uncharacterized protein BABINDRAFT_161598 [Babjeviella inositovora NRRL Y-12698]ODQ79932.1 hypothetical protein BABINDRAFT_161598 [Babjeviella inositovora NRRL Y-12698]
MNHTDENPGYLQTDPRPAPRTPERVRPADFGPDSHVAPPSPTLSEPRTPRAPPSPTLSESPVTSPRLSALAPPVRKKRGPYKKSTKKRKRAYTTPLEMPMERKGNWVTKYMVPSLFENPRPVSEDFEATLFGLYSAKRARVSVRYGAEVKDTMAALGRAADAAPLEFMPLPTTQRILSEYLPGDVQEFPSCPKACSLFVGEYDGEKCTVCGMAKDPTMSLKYNKISVWVQSMLANAQLAPLLHAHESEDARDTQTVDSFYTSDTYHDLKALKDKHGTAYYTDFTVTLMLQMGAGQWSPRSNSQFWTVSLINLNLPEALRQKEELSHILFSIGGFPERLELYLLPVHDELEELSENGFMTYDASLGREVRVRVVLAGVSGTFPTLCVPHGVCRDCGSTRHTQRSSGWLKCTAHLHRQLMDESQQTNKISAAALDNSDAGTGAYAPLLALRSISLRSFVPDLKLVLHERCMGAVLNLLGGFLNAPLLPSQSAEVFGPTCDEWYVVQTRLARAMWPAVLGPLPKLSEAYSAEHFDTALMLLPIILEHLSVSDDLKAVLYDFCAIARYLQALSLTTEKLRFLKYTALPRFAARFERATCHFGVESLQGRILTLQLLGVPFQHLDALVDAYLEFGPLRGYWGYGNDHLCEVVTRTQRRVKKRQSIVYRTPLLSRYNLLRNIGLVSPTWDYFRSETVQSGSLADPITFASKKYHYRIAAALKYLHPEHKLVRRILDTGFDVTGYASGMTVLRNQTVPLTTDSVVKFVRAGQQAFGVVRAFVTVKFAEHIDSFCLVDEYTDISIKGHTLEDDDHEFPLFRSRKDTPEGLKPECLELDEIVRPMGVVYLPGEEQQDIMYFFQK